MELLVCPPYTESPDLRSVSEHCNDRDHGIVPSCTNNILTNVKCLSERAK